MSLFYYIVLSVVYILTIQLAIGIRGFPSFQTISLFVLGGAIGWALDSYITGFVFAVVMQMMFW